MGRLNYIIFFIVSLLCSSDVFCVTVSGFVKDASNRPLAGAVVSFQCPSSQNRTISSDRYGRYRLQNLPDVEWCDLRVVFKNITTQPARINSGAGSKDINITLIKVNNVWQISL